MEDHGEALTEIEADVQRGRPKDQFLCAATATTSETTHDIDCPATGAATFNGEGPLVDRPPAVLLVLGSYLTDAQPQSAQVDPEVEQMRRSAEKRYGRSSKW